MEKLDTNEIINMVNDQFRKSGRNLNRQDYNIKIFNHLSEQKFFEKFVPEKTARDMYDILEENIYGQPDWRFGQSMCNTFPNDDRSEVGLNHIFDMLFYGSKTDPFYEESEETYKRLLITK